LLNNVIDIEPILVGLANAYMTYAIKRGSVEEISLPDVLFYAEMIITGPYYYNTSKRVNILWELF